MIGKPYAFFTKEYIKAEDVSLFTFISEGEYNVVKAVRIEPVDDSLSFYSLGLGDARILEENGNYSIDENDSTQTGDAEKVFFTVISALTEFFAAHPKANVRIIGNTDRSISLHIELICKYWKDLVHTYHVEGTVQGRNEIFIPGRQYDYIIVSLRLGAKLNLMIDAHKKYLESLPPKQANALMALVGKLKKGDVKYFQDQVRKAREDLKRDGFIP